ncbi:MAG: hypothetical protein ACM3L6_04325 [Deltaproteobacteria bacterium]
MKRLNPVEVIDAWGQARGARQTLTAAAYVCGAVLFQPIPFFQVLSRRKDNLRRQLLPALAFAVVLGYVKLLCDGLNVMWLKQLVVSGAPAGVLSAQVAALEDAFFSSPVIFIRPLVTLAATFVFVAAGVKLILGVEKPLGPAVLVICYKSAADVYTLVPFVGSLLASAWSLALVVIGVREVYRTGAGRALLAGIVMPFFVLFFLALSMGPSANRFIVSLYPETRPQVMRFNDVAAYGITGAIVQAAADYKNDLGFYPVGLSTLKKYLTEPAAGELNDDDNAAGYHFSYSRGDDGHFVIVARPQQDAVSGSLVFYADESGKIRRDGKDGRVLSDTQSVEAAAAPALEEGTWQASK